MSTDAPLVLELAPLPRNQIGPFLVLGLDKDASPEALEAVWAQRLIAARKGQSAVSLEDINWARDLLNDPAKRRRAEVGSLNADTAEGTLRKLREQFMRGAPADRLIESETDLSAYEPPTPAIAPDEIRRQIRVPELPLEFGAVESLLRDAYREPPDPWSFTLDEPNTP